MPIVNFTIQVATSSWTPVDAERGPYGQDDSAGGGAEDELV